MKLGIVGTNQISKLFVDSAYATQKYQLQAVYSRSLKNGESFINDYPKAILYTNWEQFLASDVDVVYVASPNSVHYEQCYEIITHKKHVIVEKPAFSNTEELRIIHQLAKKNGVFVFEAARHIHEENFKRLKNSLNTIGNITGANFTYMKYSSRYDAVKQGEEPNIFSLRYSGGALYDLGIYLIYAAVALFGVPRKEHYFPKIIDTGVDGIGQILFEYDRFNIMMLTGKISNSEARSEIFGDEGTLSIDSIEYISSIIHNKQKKNLAHPRHQFNMSEEAEAFYQIIQKNDIDSYDHLTFLSASVHRILETLRKKNNIIFKADII